MPDWLNYTLSPTVLILGAYALVHTISRIFVDGGLSNRRIGTLVSSMALVYLSMAGVASSHFFGFLRKNHSALTRMGVGLGIVALFGIIGVLKALVELNEQLGQALNSANPQPQSLSVTPLALAGGAVLLGHLGFHLAPHAPSLQSGALLYSRVPELRSMLQSATQTPLPANPIGTYLIAGQTPGTTRALIVSAESGGDRVQLATLHDRTVVLGTLNPRAAYRPLFRYDPSIAMMTSNPDTLDAQSAEQGLMDLAEDRVPLSTRQAALNEAGALSKYVSSRAAN